MLHFCSIFGQVGRQQEAEAARPPFIDIKKAQSRMIAPASGSLDSCIFIDVLLM
ncbi:hypothetical protein WJ0W_002684 [Paenibacillus melissococcoides]|uniref:Uncharacterized protein n=1 Tax=Paenibacillus melissococcoides TaxID=2912268 RepID=A0ABM9G2A1_9BACL|nr:hypothetical protein WJ0W_002684 [Paenibacillus melissococcoides]